MSAGDIDREERVELDLGGAGGPLALKIDTAYAAKYEKRKRGEELSKLRDKYGPDSDSYSSDSDLEDEFGKGLSVENDKSFLRVLSLIKQNDSSLYDPNTKFYVTESDTSISGDEGGMFLRDYEREKLLKDGPKQYDSGSDLDGDGRTDELAYNPEQRELKRELLEAANGISVNRDNENDELNESEFLKPRIKSSTEIAREERDYADWLKTNPLTELDPPQSLSDTQTSDLSNLRNFWSHKDLSEEDRFLRDYLLEEKHLGGEDGSVEGGSEFDELDLEQLDAADDFERKYNFRFEEDEGSLIARYPRIILNSVRREDTRRRDQRQQRVERKEGEKIQEREEVKRLKNLKKMEIQDKIDLIKNITGNKELGVGSIDVTGDFNAEEYDKQMSLIFNDDYWGEKETVKPNFSSILPPDLQDSDSELHCEDEGFNMDADYMEERGDKYIIGNDDSVATNHTKAIEDYYKLDYEDRIGELTCRMKYREVIPNSFGLTTEEILSAEDRELNQWASLKKTMQFRSEHDEKRDVKKYNRKSRDWKKKERVFLSMYKDSPEKDEQNPNSSRKGSVSLSKHQKRIKMNNKLSESQKNVLSGMSSGRLKAFHIDPKKGIAKPKRIN